MSQHQLTKQEAFELISSVIDGEVDQKTRKAFFRYIKDDPYIRKQYSSAKKIKELLGTRCPSVKAPDHLKFRIREALATEHSARRKPPSEELVYDIPCKRTPCSYKPETSVDFPLAELQPFQQTWMYLGATVFLITILLWGLVVVSESSPSTPTVEEFASRYYSEFNGAFIPPAINISGDITNTASLSSGLNLPFPIPEVDGALFQGIAYTDVNSQFQAPLLEYYLSSEDRYIYVFAFDMEMINNSEWLSHHEEFANKCTNSGNYHIQKVNGNQVVSWKENDIWYTAISDQDGETLVSRMQN